ncbi:hypothetical protein FDECE_3305 [Fusarium decemcellulare]|nr:hypothetical protein FDECE_3305 [Fusarium decemcellulare]
MADYSEYGRPAGEWANFVESGSLKPPPAGLTLDERRNYLNERRGKLHKEFYGAPSENIEIIDISIPTPDNSSVKARLYRPRQDKKTKLPLIIHLHSGGWHLGNLETEEPFCAWLCSSLYDRKPPGFAVLNVNYRHTPEYSFPTQLNDTYAALEHFTEVPPSGQGLYNVDPMEVFLSGTSAGAHLAIGCMVRDLRSRAVSGQGRGQRIKGLILTCPPTVHPDLFPFHLMRSKDVSSYVENANDPVLGINVAKTFWGLYLANSNEGLDEEDQAVKSQALISPLISDEAFFDGDLWPQTSFYVAGLDCLRDEALLFEEKLRSKGVNMRLHVYEGFPHAFNLLPQLEESKKWRENMLDDLLRFTDTAK